MNYKSIICLFFLLLSPIALLAQDDDIVEGDSFPKVRIAYNAPSGFYRQLLIGFQAGLCTDAIDPGFDAVTNVVLPSDMYFWCNSQPLFIQGVGAFVNTNSYPLGIKSSIDGNMSINLVSTENFDNSHSIYIHDAETNLYHNLKNGNFVVPVTAGTILNRFSLRFYQTTLGIDGPETDSKMSVSYLSTDRVILVEKGITPASAGDLFVLNMQGQQIAKWSVDLSGSTVTIPASGLSSGTYIVRLQTEDGELVKKIAVR